MFDSTAHKELATYYLVVPRVHWGLLPCENSDILKLYEEDPSYRSRTSSLLNHVKHCLAKLNARVDILSSLKVTAQ